MKAGGQRGEGCRCDEVLGGAEMIGVVMVGESLALVGVMLGGGQLAMIKEKLGSRGMVVFSSGERADFAHGYLENKLVYFIFQY